MLKASNQPLLFCTLWPMKSFEFCASGQESGMTSRALCSWCRVGHVVIPFFHTVPYEERNTGGLRHSPCRALNLGQRTGPPGCSDFRFFAFNPSERDTLKMAGAIIENMSTKKLVIVGVILLLFQAFSFMVGGLIGEWLLLQIRLDFSSGFLLHSV